MGLRVGGGVPNRRSRLNVVVGLRVVVVLLMHPMVVNSTSSSPSPSPFFTSFCVLVLKEKTVPT